MPAAAKAPHTEKEKGQIWPGYIGLFSSYKEWHAFFIGFYYGAREKYNHLPEQLSDPNDELYNEDVDQKFHYAVVGYDVGELYQRHKKKIHVGGFGLASAVAGGIYKAAELAATTEIISRLIRLVLGG